MGQTIAQSYIEAGKAIGKEIGALNNAREILIDLACQRLSVPDATTLQILNGISDLARLKRMLRQHNDAATWADYLAIQ